MFIFNVIKIDINKKSDSTNYENTVSSQVLESFHFIDSAIKYTSSLTELNVNNETISIQQNLLNEKPSIKDVDGLYLVKDEIGNKYHMYNKTTNELKGYVYNSVDIQITYVGYIEICESKIQCRGSHNSHNSHSNQKNQNKKNKKHSKTVQTNISLTNMSSKKHKKRKMLTETINDGHLNYELIIELKEKLKKIKENREKKES